MIRAWIDGVVADRLPIDDRGLNYGDGLFETVLIEQGNPVWWDAHISRLRHGCEAIGLTLPKVDDLLDEARRFVAGEARAVLKLLLTRGSDGRGYAPQAAARLRRIMSLHPAPELPIDRYREGVVLRWCELQLALQPRLAGFKHLNRLEHVLARAEWNDPTVAEGMLCDTLGRVICATAANVFIVREGRLVTPDLDNCGVAGVCRAWILRQADVQVTQLTRPDIENADELFLSSSVRGILPITRLGGRSWSVGPMTRTLQQRLWRTVPALEPMA